MPKEFQISSSPIDPSVLRESFSDSASGAFVAFEGWVRNHNEGKPVVALEYEAYPALAEKEGLRIVTEAKEKFGPVSVMALHRVGPLEIGELAVWVGASAPHRDAAFAACRYVIDETKARVPIWKKEHYADGASDWINCTIVGEKRA